MPERVAIEEPPPLPPDSGQLKRKSTFWPILVTIVGGIGLAYGSFYAACSPEARNSDFTRAFGWALGPALLVLVCTAVGLGLDSYPQYVIAVATISMVVGIALVVLVGLARCITLASGSIMAIGGYASTLAVANLHIPYLATLVLAILAGGAAMVCMEIAGLLAASWM